MPFRELPVLPPIRAAIFERIEEARYGLPPPKMYEGAIYEGKLKRNALIIEAPEVLSVEENRDGFLGLIYAYQSRAFARQRNETVGPRSWSIDLGAVKVLTLDAALVLVAEYHRRVKLHAAYRPLIDDKGWSPSIRALMHDLGFYDLVRASGRTGDRVGLQNRLRFVPFRSGQKIDQHVARGLIDALRDAAGQEPEREHIYAALVEAMINVKHHAYPEGTSQAGLPSVASWWAAGAYDPQDQILQFAVYDQGVGIPATLPRQDFFEAVRRFCPPEWNDADIIAGGVRYGRTRFRAQGLTKAAPSGRGNGLWTICNFISQLSGSSVRIISGRGEVRYSGGRTVEKFNFANPFCGTLIQWSLKLPSKPPAAAAEVPA